MGEFDGRVVVVTGGGIGLGKTFSRGFASAGAKAVVADIAEEEAKTIAKEIDGLAVRVDVSSESDTQAMAKAAHDKYGRIDVLINNASLRSIQRIHQPDDLGGAVMFLASDQAGFPPGHALYARIRDRMQPDPRFPDTSETLNS